jgi:hypothetical protein
MPLRIKHLDQINLLLTRTLFNLFFTRDRQGHGVMHLAPHQQMQRIFFSEPFNHPVFVLPHAAGQVAGHANIQRAVRAVGHDVHAGLLHA